MLGGKKGGVMGVWFPFELTGSHIKEGLTVMLGLGSVKGPTVSVP